MVYFVHLDTLDPATFTEKNKIPQCSAVKNLSKINTVLFVSHFLNFFILFSLYHYFKINLFFKLYLCSSLRYDHINPVVLAEFVYNCQWQPTPILLPGKSHGRRSLVGCSPRGR